MSDQFVLRPAPPSDFAFCQRLYFDGMGWIIEALKLDIARQRQGFGQQWQLAEVRIISVAGDVLGWLQTTPALVAAAGDEHNSNPNLSRRSSVVRDHSVLDVVKTENPTLESRRKFGASMH